MHGADDELPGTGAYGHGGHAGGGYGPPSGAAAAAGAAPWELVKAAGAGLPLTHLGREKAGNAEITRLQVGLAHKAVVAGGLLQACWAVESRKLLLPLPIACHPRQPSHAVPAVVSRYVQVDPSVTFDTVGGLDHYIKVGWGCWQGGWKCVGLLPSCHSTQFCSTARREVHWRCITTTGSRDASPCRP